MQADAIRIYRSCRQDVPIVTSGADSEWFVLVADFLHSDTGDVSRLDWEQQQREVQEEVSVLLFSERNPHKYAPVLAISRKASLCYSA